MSKWRDQVMEVIESQANVFAELEEQRQTAIQKRSKGFCFLGIAAIVWLAVAFIVMGNSGEPFFALIVGVIGFGVSFALLHSLFIGKYKAEYLVAY